MTLLLSAGLVVSCGEPIESMEGVNLTEASREEKEPRVRKLTCRTDERIMGIFDHFKSGGGEETLVAAAAPFVGPDDFVVDRSARGGPAVWVLRPDGTAHTRWGLRQFADGTWVVERQDSCADGVRAARRSKGS